MIFSQQRI